jgi:putative selenium metabolism hydrolase
MQKEVLESAQKHEKKCVQFLLDLIATPSLSGQEGDVIERVRQEMEKLGYDEITVDPMGNILGRIGEGPVVVALDAHVDTVDVGDPTQWKRDPFKGVVEKGIVYGRGAGDMKGALAAIVYGGALAKALGLTDGVTLYVVGSVQEEDCDGLCWQYIVQEDKLRPDCVVIAEPTNLNLYRGHRGRMEMEVRTRGLSAHGAMPHRGVNAIYKMAPIIADIEKLNDRLKDDPFLGKGTITISEIRSTSPSLCAVADSATIHLDRRLTRGETLESAVAEIQALESVQRAEAEVVVLEYDTPSYTGLSYPTQKYYPTWVIDEDHVAVQAGVETCRQLFGSSPEVGKWKFSTNGVSTMGRFRIPTVGFGPGNEIYAHSPDDQVPVDHLTKAMAFYAAFSQTLCQKMETAR